MMIGIIVISAVNQVLFQISCIMIYSSFYCGWWLAAVSDIAFSVGIVCCETRLLPARILNYCVVFVCLADRFSPRSEFMFIWINILDFKITICRRFFIFRIVVWYLSFIICQVPVFYSFRVCRSVIMCIIVWLVLLRIAICNRLLPCMVMGAGKVRVEMFKGRAVLFIMVFFFQTRISFIPEGSTISIYDSGN